MIDLTKISETDIDALNNRDVDELIAFHVYGHPFDYNQVRVSENCSYCGRYYQHCNFTCQVSSEIKDASAAWFYVANHYEDILSANIYYDNEGEYRNIKTVIALSDEYLSINNLIEYTQSREENDKIVARTICLCILMFIRWKLIRDGKFSKF